MLKMIQILIPDQSELNMKIKVYCSGIHVSNNYRDEQEASVMILKFELRIQKFH